MKPQNYTATIVANVTAEKAFENINHVSAWWASDIEGSSEKLDDVFTVTFGDTFVTFRIIEAVPGKKITWLVTDCYLHWLTDKTEWANTKVSFEISEAGDATQINFTHIGLLPEVECYDMCVKGWDFFVKQSLLKLITEGKGMPERPKAERVEA